MKQTIYQETVELVEYLSLEELDALQNLIKQRIFIKKRQTSLAASLWSKIYGDKSTSNLK